MITPRRMNRHFIVSVLLGVLAGLVIAFILLRAFAPGDYPFLDLTSSPAQKPVD